MNQNENDSIALNKKRARGLASAVYLGVIIVATVMFITFVLTAFEEGQYMTRAIMVIGGVLVGLSTAAFPVALHNWALEDNHHTITTVLYFGEMVFLTLNTIVSFTALLANQGVVPMPEWMKLYEPYSIVSIVYVIFAWGIVFLTDPDHKDFAEKAKEKREDEKLSRDTLRMQEKANQIRTRKMAEMKLEYLQTTDAEEAMRGELEAELGHLVRGEAYQPKKTWGAGQAVYAADTKAQALKDTSKNA